MWQWNWDAEKNALVQTLQVIPGIKNKWRDSMQLLGLQMFKRS